MINDDAICNIIAPFARSDLQIRCQYDLNHIGNHSWEKFRHHFVINSYCGLSEEQILEKGFLNSVFNK